MPSREEGVRTQPHTEGRKCEARGEDSEGASPVGSLISDVQRPELGQNKMSVFQSPRLWCFVMAAQSFKRLDFIFNDLMDLNEKIGSDK